MIYVDIINYLLANNSFVFLLVISVKLKRFIQYSSVKSALSTLILIVPIVLGFWNNLDSYLKAVFVIVIASFNVIFVYYDYKKPAWKIEKMLELMIKSLWGTDQASHFRSNVMIFESKTSKLQIKHSYNMMGMIDRNLALQAGNGCAGKAFKDENAFWVDLTQATHESYLVDSKRVWSDMKSVMSVPINLDGKVIGVLNIDSSLELKSVFLDNEEKVLNVARAYSDLVAEWL